VLIREITVSNIEVVRAILSPRLPIQPHFLRVRTRQTTDLGKVILANSITLTPGTVTVDVQGDELLVHALTESSGRAVEEGHLDRAVPLDCEERA
jgi:multicomponent Na+:H+ antiporter subunit E